MNVFGYFVYYTNNSQFTQTISKYNGNFVQITNYSCVNAKNEFVIFIHDIF